MAANFRMTRYRKKNSLYLKLSGDFDGSSAMELICMLAENAGEERKIYIETDNIDSIHPFGRDVFLKNFPMPRQSSRKIVFIGSQGREIAPIGVYCMNDNQTGSISSH